VLATISGNYEGTIPFNRGTFGKYLPFSTQMGLCIPQQCEVNSVVNNLEPLLVRYAAEAHWTDIKVDYQFSTKYQNEVAHAVTAPKRNALIVCSIILLIIIVCTTIDVTRIGDNSDYKKDVISQATKFRSSHQLETVSL